MFQNGNWNSVVDGRWREDTRDKKTRRKIISQARDWEGRCMSNEPKEKEMRDT